jgi:twinkle protein
MDAIAAERPESKTELLIKQQGWTSRPVGNGDNVAVQVCPFDSSHGQWKFFIAVGGEKDGLWNCKVCSKEGNYYQLKEQLGLTTQNTVSLQDAAMARTAPEAMLDFDRLHHSLMNKPECSAILDYLVHERKFSIEIIERLKLGAARLGEDLAFVIPYYDAAGVPVFYKMRTIPPAKKRFKGASGRENPLFNEAVLKPGMDELLMVEGEADAIALMSAGYETVVGIPGAGQKKASWVDKIDRLAPKNIYLMYDNDKVGQDAAHEMAVRIGLDRVRNIVLPAFDVYCGVDEHGADVYKPGKDINEWLAAGHPIESLDQLKAEARPFDVQGVQSLIDVLDDLKSDLEEHGTEPKYSTPWPSFTKRIGGFEDGDVCGLMAEGKVGKTTMALDWVDWYAENGTPSMLFCGEMKAVRLVRKWVSYKLQIDDTPGRSEFKPEHVDQAMALVPNYKSDLLFGYSRSNKPDEVFSTIRQAVRRYGVKVVCYDNLQLMSRSMEHQTQEISRLTKEFKALAMELNIFIILIIQPNRVAEGQIVAARNAMGSSAIEKDVDYMVCLHRNRVGKISASEFNGFMDTEENFEPHLLVRVDLSRFSPGGTCTLWMDGARSTVREMVQEDITAIPKHTGAIQEAAIEA